MFDHVRSYTDGIKGNGIKGNGPETMCKKPYYREKKMKKELKEYLADLRQKRCLTDSQVGIVAYWEFVEHEKEIRK